MEGISGLFTEGVQRFLFILFYFLTIYPALVTALHKSMQKVNQHKTLS